MTRAVAGSALDAGASATEQAELFEPVIDSAVRQLRTLTEAVRQLRQGQRNWQQGAIGERQAAARVQQVMVDLGSTDWHLLADRRRPGTRSANLDLILVGPPGVVLIDAKSWHDPRVENGRLWRGQNPEDDTLESARSAADAVADLLSHEGLAPSAVRALVLLVGRRLPGVELDGVVIVGEKDLQPVLVRMGARLDSAHIAAVVAALDDRCPPAGRHAARTKRVVRAADDTETPVADSGDALIDIEEIWAAAVDVAAREPIEAWMTWLHPAQAQLVGRHFTGPARVRGAAGTGKTVIALHRARELARRPGAKVLVTSYVRTLPDVQRALFARLAPELARRVEFRGLHSWAASLLRKGAVPCELAPRGGRALLDEAWQHFSSSDCLAALGLPRDYWWDEVQQVIKGRGLTSEAEYLALLRVGRRVPLRSEQRRAVWALFAEYERRREAAGVVDWADVLLLALAEVRRGPLAVPYTSVIVDEIQDLTCVGMRLLHALVGDAPDGLFLVGDGQQSVYPGGFTLTEAGVTIAGARATVLHLNYRNKAEILRAALDVVSGDAFDDLDDDPSLPGQRAVESAQPGGLVLRVSAEDAESQRAALVIALLRAQQDGVRLGDMAILVADNRKAERWVETLIRARIPASLLVDYDGTTTESVKVGTYQRAKGLEFACVFLPDHDRAVPARGDSEDEGAYAERAALQRRCLFVAMTRARDRLWLGSTAGVSLPPASPFMASSEARNLRA